MILGLMFSIFNNNIIYVLESKGFYLNIKGAKFTAG